MKSQAPVNVVALIPWFYRDRGDGVNERQLINAISKRVRRVYVFAFEGVKELVKVKKRRLNLSRNVIHIPIPLIEIPLISTMLMFFISYLLSFVLLVLNYIIKIGLIYIRYSPLSMGIVTFNPLASKVVVKIPSIIEEEIRYGSLVNRLAKEFITITDKIILLRAKAIAAPSEELYRELLKKRNVQRVGNFIKAMPGVDLDLIEKIKRASYEKRDSRSKVFVVGFMGSLMWWQGVEILVKAIALLRKQKIPIHLLIIGDGPQRPLVEAMLRALKINYEITGVVPHERALKLLKMADVLVLPRLHAPFTESLIPIKVLEAWALGIPVIVTRHKVFIKLGIKDHEDLIYCEPDPENVAERLLCLLRDSDLRLKLSMKGPKIARRFAYDEIVDELLSIATKTTP